MLQLLSEYVLDRKRKLIMSNNDEAITSPTKEGIITKLSPFSVEETLERLQTTINSRGLSVFAHINHSGEAEKVGLKMQKAHVLIFGSPKAGTPLMIASPLLALDLPLKALIWQDHDDHVWVSYNSTEYLATRYAIPPTLTRNIAGIDLLITSALQS
jgi:uncharacterized protein (DUF302 family)